MTKLDELLDPFRQGPSEKLLPELQRIRRATELSAALQAHAFFMKQGTLSACERLAPIIQRLTGLLCLEELDS